MFFCLLNKPLDKCQDFHSTSFEWKPAFNVKSKWTAKARERKRRRNPKGKLPKIKRYVLVEDGLNVEHLLDKCEDIAWFQKEVKDESLYNPTDPEGLNYAWTKQTLTHTSATTALDVTKGSGVVIGIAEDSSTAAGADYSDPELGGTGNQANDWAAIQAGTHSKFVLYTDSEENPIDPYGTGHGNSTARQAVSVIDNALNYCGAMPEGKVMFALTNSRPTAILRLADLGADIISVSYSSGYTRSVQSDYCWAAGIPLVYAHESNTHAEYSYVTPYKTIFVGGFSVTDVSERSYSEGLTFVSRGASGSQESLATPVVASILALVLEHNPTWSVEDCLAAVIYSCQKPSEMAGENWHIQYGFGIPDAYAAVQMVSSDLRPLTPYSFTANVSVGTNIHFQWASLEITDLDHYEIRHSTSDYPTNLTEGTQVYTGTDYSTYVDVLTTEDHYFTLFAVDTRGNFNILTDYSKLLVGEADGLVATRKPIVLVDGDLQELTTTDHLELGASKLIEETAQNAIVGGILTGNTRGNYALDIQSKRSNVNKVAASNYSVAIGFNNEIASAGTHSVALGNSCYAGTHKGQIAIGYLSYSYGGNYNLSLGATTFSAARYATSIGQGVYATAEKTIAIGYNVTASALRAVALGTSSAASAVGAIAIGDSAVNNSASYSIAIGESADVASSAIKAVAVGYNSDVDTSETIAIGSSASIGTTATEGIAIGKSATIVNAAVYSIVIGSGSTDGSKNVLVGAKTSSSLYGSFKTYNVAIGYNANTTGYGNTVIGADNTQTITVLGAATSIGLKTNTTDYATAIGYTSTATGLVSVALGMFATASGGYSMSVLGTASGDNSIALGYTSNAQGSFSVAIGDGLTNSVDKSMVSKAPILPALASGTFENNSGSLPIFSVRIDAKATGTTTIAIPSGSRFFVDEIGIIVDDYSSISVQPYLSFGITGNNTKFAVSAQTTGLTALGTREIISIGSNNTGETTLNITVDTAATGTTLILRVYWKGVWVTD